jgi:hypothetical protein
MRQRVVPITFEHNHTWWSVVSPYVGKGDSPKAAEVDLEIRIILNVKGSTHA